MERTDLAPARSELDGEDWGKLQTNTQSGIEADARCKSRSIAVLEIRCQELLINKAACFCNWYLVCWIHGMTES